MNQFRTILIITGTSILLSYVQVIIHYYYTFAKLQF
jgi:hypothetical protein